MRVLSPQVSAKFGGAGGGEQTLRTSSGTAGSPAVARQEGIHESVLSGLTRARSAGQGYLRAKIVQLFGEGSRSAGGDVGTASAAPADLLFRSAHMLSPGLP